jgi:transposase InsO family protein
VGLITHWAAWLYATARMGMLRAHFKDQEITPRCIILGKPWQNGSNESLNGTFRGECLDAEVFRSLVEAQVVIEDWRRLSNQPPPHSSLGYRAPAMAYWGLRLEKSTHSLDHKGSVE